MIPISVDNAGIPLANQLPPSLAPLDQGTRLRSTPIFDTRRLIIAVQKALVEQSVVQTLHISRPTAYP